MDLLFKLLVSLSVLISLQNAFTATICAAEHHVSTLSGRLLVNVRANAQFSPRDFAEKTHALLVHVDPRNSFKTFLEVYKDAGFVVLSEPLDHRVARRLRAPFGQLMIPIPAQPECFLNRTYGLPNYPESWQKYALEPTHDHKRETPMNDRGAALVEIDDSAI